jgi:ubiquinone biosynthesis protein COQ9
MINPPERSPERDVAIDAILPRVPGEGWTTRALRGALRDLGSDPDDAALLFPGGAPDMVETFIDLIDRRMAGQVDAESLPAKPLPARVRAIIVGRLELLAPHKDAVRRALAVLAYRGDPVLAARCAARTVDEIWHLAGDRSADFSWYTKRAILAGVYNSTLLFWLRDHDSEHAATLAFLDRRLAGVASIPKFRRAIASRIAGLRPRCMAAT